jgi:hypothetical protein
MNAYFVSVFCKRFQKVYIKLFPESTQSCHKAVTSFYELWNKISIVDFEVAMVACHRAAKSGVNKILRERVVKMKKPISFRGDWLFR